MIINWAKLSLFSGFREKCNTDRQNTQVFIVFLVSEKDVTRTDRTHKFFEGEGNPNLQVLNDILMTYCMFNFDLGKCPNLQ